MGQVYATPRLRVFLSSTYEDLKAYVHAAEEVLSECVEVDHFKHWEATGRPTIAQCRERVRACNALVVLLGKTYGWIPGVEEGGDGRTSITRFEVQWAHEKAMPVVPFFIQDPLQVATDSSPDTARLQTEFVAELQRTIGKPVASLEVLRQEVRKSILALARQFPEMGSSRPTTVGRPTQGLCAEFLDREEPRHRLRSILAEGPSRGAVIVGRGGLGKSALANWVIDQLQQDRDIKQVIYLDPASAEPVESVLFRSTMEASGRPKAFYEASWAHLNANHQALIEVLLDEYLKGDILLMCDAFEHHLDETTGAIRSPLVRAFVKAFVESHHTSKLLITTRQFPLLSTREAAALQEILLDRGLPLEAGVSLLMSQSPEGNAQREQIEAAVKAVDGIPFALERMANLLHGDRMLALRDQVVHEEMLDAFVALTHSKLSPDAHLTLQARAVFNEQVPIDALKHVLTGVLNPPAVESAVKELGRGHLLFRIGPDALLGVHELDQEASYRSIESDVGVDRKQLHARAADYYARLCEDREYWFQWTSYDELRSDLKRFHHLVKAEQPRAAADAFSFSKVDFLSSSGHVKDIADMFGGLDLDGQETRALLVKRYVLAHHLAIVGPFEDAIPKLCEVIELARRLGETHAELSATYELGTAYRYTGQYKDAVRLHESLTKRLRERGADELLAYYLYGHSLACSYAGLYAEAIRLGHEQVRHGARSGRSEFKARGNSSLCLPYYVIGMASEAAACAAASAGQFANTPKEHLLGFIENVHGLALHALGRWTEAVDAFSRGRESSRESRRRRAGGLIAVNWGWALYDRGDLVGALSQIHDAIRAFDGISEADARLSHNLREAFEYAQDGDRRYEVEALWNFVASEYVNPDLIRRVSVAERILSLEGLVPSHIRQLAQAYVDAASSTLTGLRAELDT